MHSIILRGSLVGLGLVVASTANAAQYNFELFNHPDGGARSPLYGLRLDNLFDVGDGNDIFTFDFNEYEGTHMRLTYDDGDGPTISNDPPTERSESIRIHGIVWGGLDTGSAYGNADYRGYWEVDFTYTSNLDCADNGASTRVTAEDPANNGFIRPLFAVGGDASADGLAIDLSDKQGNHPYSFRFQDNDWRLGSHGLDGQGILVGNGWMNHRPGEKGDWLFTGQAEPVPEPGTLALLGLGLTGVGARVRRRMKRDKKV